MGVEQALVSLRFWLIRLIEEHMENKILHGNAEIQKSNLSSWIGFLNTLFSLYYFSEALRDILGLLKYDFSGSPMIGVFTLNLLSAVFLGLGGILLLRGNQRGKLFTNIVGVLGVIMIVMVTIWAISLLWVEPYSTQPEAVWANVARQFGKYSLQFLWPIAVSLFWAIKK
jgi:hypothetical protein